jgi:hypothetical protein
MTQCVTRRIVLQRGLQLCAGALAAGLSACGGGSGNGEAPAVAAACADPAAMNASEANAREAYGYVEASADPQKRCAGCTFYHAAEGGGDCGTCDIFNGGPANAGGHCTSWTAAGAPAAPAAGA